MGTGGGGVDGWMCGGAAFPHFQTLRISLSALQRPWISQSPEFKGDVFSPLTPLPPAPPPPSMAAGRAAQYGVKRLYPPLYKLAIVPTPYVVVGPTEW